MSKQRAWKIFNLQKGGCGCKLLFQPNTRYGVNTWNQVLLLPAATPALYGSDCRLLTYVNVIFQSFIFNKFTKLPLHHHCGVLCVDLLGKKNPFQDESETEHVENLKGAENFLYTCCQYSRLLLDLFQCLFSFIVSCYPWYCLFLTGPCFYILLHWQQRKLLFSSSVLIFYSCFFEQIVSWRLKLMYKYNFAILYSIPTSHPSPALCSLYFLCRLVLSSSV